MRCKAMKWAHLPMAGGMYDQDPMLWHWFEILWHEEGLEAKRDQDRREAEMKQKKAGGGKRVAGRRRGR